MKSMKLLAAVAMLAALVVPATGSADHTGCSSPYAKLVQPSGGQVVVNAVAVQTPAGQSLMLSTTGTIEVKVEHDCTSQVGLVVTKTGPGAPAVIHTNSWSLPCGWGTISEDVRIGLDAGTYQFDVNGTACDGRKLRTDGHGSTVVDPPLPTP